MQFISQNNLRILPEGHGFWGAAAGTAGPASHGVGLGTSGAVYPSVRVSRADTDGGKGCRGRAGAHACIGAHALHRRACIDRRACKLGSDAGGRLARFHPELSMWRALSLLTHHTGQSMAHGAASSLQLTGRACCSRPPRRPSSASWPPAGCRRRTASPSWPRRP